MYAIVRTGGKQYRVTPNQIIDVEKLLAAEGDHVELTDVLLVNTDDQTVIGQPLVPDAKVIAEVVEQGRDEKITVLKYKAKTRYRRKLGHRQPYTRLAIREIVTGRA